MNNLQKPALFSCALIAALLCCTGCPGRNGGGGGERDGGSTLSLSGAYRYEIPESSQPSSITVVFAGQLTSGTSTTPDAKFSVSVTERVPIGPGKAQVLFSVPNLKPGTWSVTATPNGLGAPAKCDSVTVPGSVTLSVIQGEPRCGK